MGVSYDIKTDAASFRNPVVYVADQNGKFCVVRFCVVSRLVWLVGWLVVFIAIILPIHDNMVIKKMCARVQRTNGGLNFSDIYNLCSLKFLK